MFYKFIIIIIIIFLPLCCRGQPLEIVSIVVPPCYVVENIQVSTMVDNVEAIINKKLNIKKDFDIVFHENKVFYFYKSILWRMEVKNITLNCPFENDLYIEDNIRVVRDKNNIYITDMNMWNLIVTRKLEKVKPLAKAKRTAK